MGGFEIDVEDPRRDDLRRLLEQHRLFASGVMPFEGVHVLAPEDPGADATLFGLRVDGELLGIGALKQLDADHAELECTRRPLPGDEASDVLWLTTSSPWPLPAACAA